MIWFTADTHFGHANIIRYCDRPFETKHEHDETLIANWNAVIQKNDTVYHMGDFGFGSPEWLSNKIANRLKGRICLIKGNHDKGVIKEPLVNRFEFVKDVHFLKTQYRGSKLEIFLSHYAHRTWPKNNYGSLMLFGHSHGKMPPIRNSFDVGVDCHNYFPISLDRVVEIVKNQNFQEENQ